MIRAILSYLATIIIYCGCCSLTEKRLNINEKLEGTSESKILWPLTHKPAVLSFVYTSCRNARRCPAVAHQMAALHQSLEKDGLADKVDLVLISFDADTDTPERRIAYGKWLGVEWSEHFQFLALANAKEQPAFFEKLGVSIGYSTDEKGKMTVTGTRIQDASHRMQGTPVS